MRWLLIVIASVLLSACGDNPPKPPPNTGRYAPQINPHPKYFMMVQGYIDPELKNSIKLNWNNLVRSKITPDTRREYSYKTHNSHWIR